MDNFTSSTILTIIIINSTMNSSTIVTPPTHLVPDASQSFDIWRSTKVLHLYPVIVLDILFMLFGVVGNSVVCYISFFRMPRNVINDFVLALAVIELLGCIFSIPVDLTEIFSAFSFDFPVLCKMERYFRKAVIFSTGCILVAIAAERYKRIVKLHERHVTLSQVRWTILFAVLLSLVIAVPEAVLAGSETVWTPFGDGVVCSTYHADEYRYTIYPRLWGFLVVLLYILAITCIGVIYFVIASKIWKRGKVQTDRRSRANTPDTTLQRRVRSRSQYISRSADYGGSNNDIVSHHQYVINRLNSFSECQKKEVSLQNGFQQRQSDLFLRRQQRNGGTKIENDFSSCDILQHNTTNSYLEIPTSLSHQQQQHQQQNYSTNHEDSSPTNDKSYESIPCITVHDQDNNKVNVNEDVEVDSSNDTPTDQESVQLCQNLERNTRLTSVSSEITEAPSSTSNEDCEVLQHPKLNNNKDEKGHLNVEENDFATIDRATTGRLLSDCSTLSYDSQSSPQSFRPAFFTEWLATLSQTQNRSQDATRGRKQKRHLRKESRVSSSQLLTLTPLGSVRRRPGKNGYSRKRTTFIMFVMTLTTALSLLPNLIVLLYSLSHPGIQARLSPDVSVIYKIAWNSFFISLATHPYVYGFWNGRFKHALDVLWLGMRRGRHRHERESGSSMRHS